MVEERSHTSYHLQISFEKFHTLNSDCAAFHLWSLRDSTKSHLYPSPSLLVIRCNICMLYCAKILTAIDFDVDDVTLFDEDSSFLEEVEDIYPRALGAA